MCRQRLANILLFILILLTLGCVRRSAQGDQASNIKVEIFVQPDPPSTGESIIILEILDELNQPVEGLEIEVKGDMTHAGMTPVFGLSTDEGQGLYSVPFEWTMAGDWILQVRAEMPDGQLLDRSFDVRVVSE